MLFDVDGGVDGNNDEALGVVSNDDVLFVSDVDAVVIFFDAKRAVCGVGGEFSACCC